MADRTSQKIAELRPDVAARARALVDFVRSVGGNLVVIDARRTPEQQAQLVKSGASQTQRSYHLEGRAFDVAWMDSRGGLHWDDVPRRYWDWIGAVGEWYGLRWGGRWKSLVDLGHFEL